MPAHEDRRRRSVLDPERPRAPEEPVHRRAVEGPGAAPAVGLREPGEQLQVHLPRQTPERAVADLGRGPPHPRLQVVRHQAEHLAPDVVAVERMDVEPVEERRGGRHPHLLVVQRPDAAVDVRGGRGLAEVVADGAEHHGEPPRARQVVDAPPRLVDHQQGMSPDVAFGVPLRLLRAVDEGRELGEQPLHDAGLARQGEAQRRPRGQQEQLLELAPHPFGRQVVEGGRAAGGAGRFVDLEFQARGELHRAQHAQAVVAEGGPVDHAQALAPQVVASAVGVEVLLAQRVPGDGVDGEVAAPGGFLQRQPRVAGDRESPVAAARLRFGAGQGDVQRAELEHGESGPDAVDLTKAPQHRPQPLRGQAEDFDVDVLPFGAARRRPRRRRAVQQVVAHPAADDERPSSRVAHGAGHAVRERQLLRHRGRPGSRSRCSGTTGRAGCAPPPG